MQKIRSDLAVGVLEVLWHHFGVGKNRHEIGVSIPAWNDMEVHMLGDSGAGNSSLVDSHVEALWPHGSAQSCKATLGSGEHIGQDCGVQFFDGGNMEVGSYHQVSIVIWVEIHQNEAVLGAIEKQIVFIAVFVRLGAEDAPLIFLVVG